MLVLQRRIGEDIVIPRYGMRLRLLATFPQLTLQVITPAGSITLLVGEKNTPLPHCEVKVKLLARHTTRASLGFTADSTTKILRAEIAGRGVVGCH
jgi:sRNA-binding carbon storage regulator CsrA